MKFNFYEKNNYQTDFPIAGRAEPSVFALTSLFIFWVLVPAFSQTSEVHTFKNVRMGGGGLVSGIEYSPAQQDLVYARTDVVVPTAGIRVYRSGYPSRIL
jgi:hypothetical protein